MIEFIVVSVLIIVLARLWDFSRRRYHLAKIAAERSDDPKEKAAFLIEAERADMWFHVYSYLIQSGVILYAFHKSGLSWFYALEYGPVIIAALWVILDVVWSWKNRKPWYYIGDGKGQPVEKIFRRLSSWLNVDRFRLTWVVKLLFLLIGVAVIRLI